MNFSILILYIVNNLLFIIEPGQYKRPWHLIMQWEDKHACEKIEFINIPPESKGLTTPHAATVIVQVANNKCEAHSDSHIVPFTTCYPLPSSPTLQRAPLHCAPTPSCTFHLAHKLCKITCVKFGTFLYIQTKVPPDNFVRQHVVFNMFNFIHATTFNSIASHRSTGACCKIA